ncbi:uncharacterized protein LOC124169820 [Ischnura elegans]|uniref:uncharacterized protein LOC124169820 n=1 Tax=Ischnura elegans TaxID=197161 RepID=UPI001ED89FDC|nr:uncharacterized protein LOC124169820 [Ischnura elegans]XP_046404567.1 uncharacterized protein LOC124169820 [Ischnura elegans]XP_046404574.1 uncharacterized protein LOC124169820 [Ischnura elegans]
MDNVHSSKCDCTRSRRTNGRSLQRLTLFSKLPPVSSEAETSVGSDVAERQQLECCDVHLPRCKSVCVRHYEEANSFKRFNSFRSPLPDLRITPSESRQIHDCPNPIRKEFSKEEGESSASNSLPINPSRVHRPFAVDSTCHCLRHLSVHSSCTVRERVIRSMEPCCAVRPPEETSCSQNAEWEEGYHHGCEQNGKKSLAENRNQCRRNGHGGYRGLPGCKRLGKDLEQLPKVQECSAEETFSTDHMRRCHRHPLCAKREGSSSDLEAQQANKRSQKLRWVRSERLTKIVEGESGQSLDGSKRSVCCSGSATDVGSILTLLSPQKARVYATERVLEHVMNGSRELYARENGVAGHMHIIETPSQQKEEVFLCAERNTTSKLELPEKFKLLGHKKIGSEKTKRCAISAESEQCLKGVYQRSLAAFKMLESKDKEQRRKRFSKPLIVKKASPMAPSNRKEFHSCIHAPLPVM